METQAFEAGSSEMRTFKMGASKTWMFEMGASETWTFEAGVLNGCWRSCWLEMTGVLEAGVTEMQSNGSDSLSSGLWLLMMMLCVFFRIYDLSSCGHLCHLHIMSNHGGQKIRFVKIWQ